jgi:hypothetical protein
MSSNTDPHESTGAQLRRLDPLLQHRSQAVRRSETGYVVFDDLTRAGEAEASPLGDRCADPR